MSRNTPLQRRLARPIQKLADVLCKVFGGILAEDRHDRLRVLLDALRRQGSHYDRNAP